MKNPLLPANMHTHFASTPVWMGEVLIPGARH